MRLLISAFLILLTTSVFAQSEVVDTIDAELTTTEIRPFKPGHKDLGVTANVSGLIGNIAATPRTDLRGANLLMVRYVQSDLVTLRFGLAPSVMSIRQISADSIGKDLVEIDSTARQSAISFRPGIELHLKGSPRLDPYIALDAEAGVIGQLRAGTNTSITDTTGVGKINRTITEDGGFSIGASLGLGMNYFIAKRLSLGLEYGAGIRYLVTGGDRQEVIQSDPTTGVATTTRILSSTRNSATIFAVDPTVQLTISYFFSL